MRVYDAKHKNIASDTQGSRSCQYDGMIVERFIKKCFSVEKSFIYHHSLMTYLSRTAGVDSLSVH